MRIAATLAGLALLAGCAEERAPEPAATPTVAAPRTLVAADLDPASLGARVEGMDVVDAAIGSDDGPLANVSAFVACARDVPACDPARLPEGTVYTYVLTITPAALPATPPPIATPIATGTEPPLAAPQAPAELIRTTRPAPGFNGALGFARAAAAAALGDENALTVTLDQNQLIWRVTGGAGWEAGRPITLWWQSTRAPEKPAPAYRFEYGGKSATLSAPFPAADNVVDP